MNSFFLDKTYATKYPEDSEYLNVPEDAETFEEIFLTDYVKGEPTSFKTSENVKNGNKAWLAGHLKSQRKIYVRMNSRPTSHSFPTRSMWRKAPRQI